MKKILLMLFLIFISVLTSCGYRGYSGNRQDLFSVAINSVLYLNGYSFDADFQCNPTIEIIEEDNYGRTLFSYYEKYYKGANISFSTLIICQASTVKEVYYYEDINYIIKEQMLYFPNNIKFTDEEIDYLKLINDWNKEINYDKCIKKEISISKPKIPNEKEIHNLLIEKFTLVSGEYSLFMDYLTSNRNEQKYIVYGYIRKTEKEWIYFIGLFDIGYSINLNLIVPSNVYDYRNEVIKFKKVNGWY